jgi:hypothetical protein
VPFSAIQFPIYEWLSARHIAPHISLNGQNSVGGEWLRCAARWCVVVVHAEGSLAERQGAPVTSLQAAVSRSCACIGSPCLRSGVHGASNRRAAPSRGPVPGWPPRRWT